MLTDTQREALVKETLSWIGTPYRGWSCLKGAGTDCGQLLYGIYRACGFVPALDLPKDYSLQAAQHQESTEYVDTVAIYFREITEAEVKPADIVVYKLGLAYSHAGVVISWPDYLVHAVGRHGVSGTHGLKNPLFRKGARKFFTLKDSYCEGAYYNGCTI
jgi:cell wall-associated NlpC family hydrolase